MSIKMTIPEYLTENGWGGALRSMTERNYNNALKKINELSQIQYGKKDLIPVDLLDRVYRRWC